VKRLIAIIALLPVLALAETVAITVTAPTQALTVEHQSTVITPEVVTVTAEVNVTGTETVEIAVPGPQGIPGTSAVGGGSWGSITGTLADQTDLQTTLNTKADLAALFSGSYIDLTNKPVLFSGSYTDLTNKPTIPAAQVNSDWSASGGLAQILNKPTIPEACVSVYDGAPGVQGERGFRGYSGLSGVMVVGTVTTGAPGTNAIVTNAGTPSSAIWNFTIPRGQDGDLANFTQAQIEAKIAEAGGKLQKRAVAADTETMIEIVRFAGSSSLFISASGLLVIQDAAGYRRWAFDPATWSMAMKDANNKTRWTIASTGDLTQYRGNGVKKGFQLYSAGRAVFW